MDLKIIPKTLKGTVTVPPSKSVAHRMIIAAALADGVSEISNLSPSEDILATIDCMNALGANIDFDGKTAVIKGIKNVPDKALLDCHESGSTMRFLMPVACALGIRSEFIGRGKLPQRPIKPFLEEFPKHGVEFDFSMAYSGNTLPCTLSGKLTAGRFEIDGGISSQFITGLLFALPLLCGDSEIVLTSHLESKPYVDITVGVLKKFGCEVKNTEKGYFVRGNQRFKPFSGAVEGDYSQSAFWFTANSLGSKLDILGLNENSLQGDKKIVEICNNFNEERRAFELDCSDIPDLVPILTVLASFCKGKSVLTNVARLRIKECDRLAAMEDCLNKVGGKVKAFSDKIEIEGVDKFTGGEVSSYNDHRIAMSMAVAATKSDSPIIIKGAECVAKSYPDFFEVFKALGGEISEL